MWNGKRKAVTFSYDDGVQADKRLIEIFNRHGIKGTFNISSALLSDQKGWNEHERGLYVQYIDASEAARVYEGHEVAVHTAHHFDLTTLDAATLTAEIAGDKEALEALIGKDIVGMAYPYGTYNDAVLDAVRAAGIRYARTVRRGDYRLPSDPLVWDHTCHHAAPDVWEVVNTFLNATPTEPMLLTIWGHSYEFDVREDWDHIEALCEALGGRDDIAYVTNREALGL